jgi:hypothetical protein
MKNTIKKIARAIAEALDDRARVEDFWVLDGRPMNKEEATDTKEGLLRIWEEATNTTFQPKKR